MADAFFFIVIDWFPKTVNVTQSGLDLNVTFDLAPPSYQVDSYAVYVGLRPEACGPIGFCTPISENKTAVHMVRCNLTLRCVKGSLFSSNASESSARPTKSNCKLSFF